MKIALLFNVNPVWTGGIIYLQNSIRILNFLEPEDQPELCVFILPKLRRYLDGICYPKIEVIDWYFQTHKIGLLQSLIRRKNAFVCDIVNQYHPDILFPQQNFPVASRSQSKELSWYADLQHKYYPEFFTRRKRLERDLRIRSTLKHASHILVSSQAVRDDFYKFYEVPSRIQFHTYRFVSIIDSLPSIPATELRKKYKLPEQYFMVSNQFHRHKNHKIVFQALAKLKQQGVPIHLAVTGRFPLDPKSAYLKQLHEILRENQLTGIISLLGLIPREEQLLLMKYAKAIIQPSLFEGWSTVIEDARSLQVPVIASDINVNREQLGDTGFYFPPHNSEILARLIKELAKKDFTSDLYEPYPIRMKRAAYELLGIFRGICQVVT